MNLISDWGTKKNTKKFHKSNEDYALADDNNGIYIIVDGVSRDRLKGVYPEPSPSRHVSELFVHQAYECLKQNCLKMNSESIVKQAFESGNEKILEHNRSYVGDFLPGTVGIIVLVKDNKIFYGYIGDCTGVLLSYSDKKQFTSCQTKLIHEHVKEFSAFQIRNEICNNIEHPYSYGVLDGRKEAMNFVITGCMDFVKYQGIILATDGAEEIINKMTSRELLTMSAEKILKRRLLTQNDDDKTIIIVKKEQEE